MNLDLYKSFTEAVYPVGSASNFGMYYRYKLLENLKAGRLKEFNSSVMQEAVDYFAEHKRLPKMYCEDAQAALPTSDKQNFKILCHVAGCSTCFSKVV